MPTDKQDTSRDPVHALLLKRRARRKRKKAEEIQTAVEEVESDWYQQQVHRDYGHSI